MCYQAACICLTVSNYYTYSAGLIPSDCFLMLTVLNNGISWHLVIDSFFFFSPPLQRIAIFPVPDAYLATFYCRWLSTALVAAIIE